jgi:hypothetical protein
MIPMNASRTAPAETAVHLYLFTLAGFILLLASALLAIVDFRRGFLFSEYVRSPYSAFHPAQVVILVIAVAGMFVCWRILRWFEARAPISPKYSAVFTFGTLAVLVTDLFVYRGVPAARAIASGTLNADWLQAFGVTGWLRPLALPTSYLLTVWHATMLGILISGLALTVLPLYFKSLFSRTGMMGTLTGALYELPQPFCSCCAAAMVPSYARRGASTNFALSFVVGAPMLNITTFVLAFTLLPLQFAMIRVVAGVILPTIATYGAIRLAERWGKGKPAIPVSPWTNRYTRLFNVDGRLEQPKPDNVGRSCLRGCVRAPDWPSLSCLLCFFGALSPQPSSKSCLPVSETTSRVWFWRRLPERC